MINTSAQVFGSNRLPLLIPAEYLQKIRAQAEKDYPNETCGILIGPKTGKEKITSIFSCHNVQDEYHTQDPVSFPRTARTAYFIAPTELFRIQKEARQKDCEIRVIYHSHVDAGAYFSEEDQRIALSEGEPAYSEVSYLVISVKEGRAKETVLYQWDIKSRSFTGRSLD